MHTGFHSNCFEQSIANHKDEMQRYFTDQLEAHQRQIDEKAKIIDNQKSEIESLLDKSQNLVKNIRDLETSKVRILEDFSIIKEVLRYDSGLDEKASESYVIEMIQAKGDTKHLEDKDQIKSRVSFQLTQQKLNSHYALPLIETVSVYRAFFASDIRLAISFAHATGNAKYIIQQTEPQWLTFKDFWHSGLGAIWNSAHKYPDQFHFLLLQDINLASPECYARPLLDSICGIRNNIPFGKTRYPNNLWIIATKASTDQPKIGLPLHENTFPCWGAIGFKDGLLNQNKIAIDDIPGFLIPSSLSLFRNNSDDSEGFEARVKNDLKKVFDEGE
jgi:hypothetical protein